MAIQSRHVLHISSLGDRGMFVTGRNHFVESTTALIGSSYSIGEVCGFGMALSKICLNAGVPVMDSHKCSISA
jgi:hypothetical protein